MVETTTRVPSEERAWHEVRHPSPAEVDRMACPWLIRRFMDPSPRSQAHRPFKGGDGWGNMARATTRHSSEGGPMASRRARGTSRPTISTADLCVRYGRIYTAAITDVLDKRGFYNQTLPHDIVPLAPETRLAGVAFPASGKPARNTETEGPIRAFLKLLGAVPRDAVLVMQANDDVAAHFGELSAVAMKARGVRGVVVDGATRDAAYILRERFPLFCRYRTPQDSLPRWRAVEWGRAVTIGDVRVAPGDVVVGDLDGVAVVPKKQAVEVLLECEGLLDRENQVRDAVRKGMAPLAAYEKFGVF
jgi:4-hydroxy-4-methyl-2-oxoglutarate aldolase